MWQGVAFSQAIALLINVCDENLVAGIVAHGRVGSVRRGRDIRSVSGLTGVIIWQSDFI